VTAGDLNGDAKTDLVVTNVANSGNSNPGSPLIADLDGNGKMDVVVTDADNYNVAVFLGNGDGTLQAPNTYATE